MNKSYIIILLLIFNSCSLDTKSGFWTEQKKIEEKKAKNIKVLKKQKSLVTELNSNLKIKFNYTNIQNREFKLFLNFKFWKTNKQNIKV